MRRPTALLATGVRMHHHSAGQGDDAVLLLHGWPRTAWQWRHVALLLAVAGYPVIAQGLRGAGHTSRPRRHEGVPADSRAPDPTRGGYDERSLAADVHHLLHDELGLTRPALAVGHDIGATVAVACALRYRQQVRALRVGEAPLPGTRAYEQMKGGPAVFHFAFHTVLDLPEALTAGTVGFHLQHLYDDLGVEPTAVDADQHVRASSQAGAVRAGFDLYRAFEQHADETGRPSRTAGSSRCRCWGCTDRSAPSPT